MIHHKVRDRQQECVAVQNFSGHIQVHQWCELAGKDQAKMCNCYCSFFLSLSTLEGNSIIFHLQKHMFCRYDILEATKK